MSKFKIGDRVRNTKTGNNVPYGFTGTVLEDHKIPYVEWDEKVECGSSINGLGKDGYCRARHEKHLELIGEETQQLLKITFKGQEITISELKQLLKEIEVLKE